jgi:Ni/Co efflux regulator RcnB
MLAYADPPEGHGRGHEHEDHDGHYYAPRYEPPPGYAHHGWARGEVLPPHYHDDRYVVVDYGHYGLRPPPQGYHWVRVDNDVVLVAIASGVVADVMLNLLYN